MIYNIKRNTSIIASAQVEGALTRSIMGEEIVAMTFTLDRKVDFKTNDTVEVYGNIYTMLVEPTVEEVNSMEFKYSLNFVSVKYNLSKSQFFFPDKDNKLTISEHSPIATAKQLLDLLAQNANRLATGWTVGTVDATTAKHVDFNGDNCLSALAKIAEAFDIEYWVDGNKSIHLTERNAISGYTFSYGKNKGLTSLTRTPFNDSTLVTRVYAKGSDKNIPGNYRNYSKHLKMVVPFLEKNTNKHGVIERTETFDDVYPHREGTVTAVNVSNPLQFTDIGIDFDLNATDANGNTTILINNVSAKVTFNSGQLAGYTFEIKKNGYNHATKTFELLVNKDEKDITVPSNLLRPAVGDKYVITDIIMPQSYITNAETLLQQKAQEYLNENCEQRFVYVPVLDRLYLENLNANIVLGNTVKLVAPEFSLNENLRVVKLTRNLQDKFDITIEVAEKAVLSQIVLNYIEKEKQKAVVIQQQSYNEQLARRNYLFSREFFDNVFDNTGYFNPEKIKPASIETGMIAVGGKMQQFNLVDVKLEIKNNNTALSNTAGKLVHLTLEDTPRTWNLTANTVFNISRGFNYIYAKADKVGENVVLLVTPDKIMVDSDPDFYHFMVGELSSVIDGFRRIKTLHGFTLISPNEITTGRLSSTNGQHYIDLLDDRIVINAMVSFTNDSPALEQTRKHTLQKLQIGVHNLLVGSEFAEQYYAMDAEKKKRYFDQEQIYTFSVDATSPVDFQGQIFAVGKNIVKQTFEVLASEAVSLQAGVRKRVKVTFTAVLNHIEKIFCKIQNADDTIVVQTTQPKLELGEVATDWNYSSADIKKEIAEVSKAVKEFQVNVEGAFLDGVIDSSEAKAIEKYINLINKEKGDVDVEYSKLVNDSYLPIANRNALIASKTNYDASHTALINTINVAISDGKASPQEKTDVDTKFTIYGNAIVNLKDNFTTCLKVIEKIAEQSAKNHATNINNSLKNGQVATNNSIANAANYNASVANNKATGAQYTANSANTKATTADTKATSAQSTANTAQYTANTAKTKAKAADDNAFTAKSWASVANTSANAAKSTANAANTKAGAAQSTANTANTKAGAAQSTANTANTKAGAAQSTANTANTKAVDAINKAIANAVKIAQQQATANNLTAITNRLNQKTDYINTTKINGNTVCTGVLAVGNQYGMNAFITGADTGAGGVRFGAGATWANRNTAPFRVLDNGTLYASRAYITGRINATSGNFTGNLNARSGRIGNFLITNKGIQKNWEGYSQYSAIFNEDKIALKYRALVGSSGAQYWMTMSSLEITSDAIKIGNVEITGSGIKINGRQL